MNRGHGQDQEGHQGCWREMGGLESESRKGVAVVAVRVGWLSGWR